MSSTPRPAIDFRLGDVVRLRKPHPCGGTDWGVVRLGADIGLKCQTCGHRILVPRSQVEQRMKTFVAQAGGAEAPGPVHLEEGA